MASCLASLLFLLMTLGPSIAALPLLERWRGGIGRVLEVFGRVPLFDYVLHIPAIHVAAIVVSLLRTGAVSPWLFANHPMEPGPPPPDTVWSLPLLYLVTAGGRDAALFPLPMVCGRQGETAPLGGLDVVRRPNGRARCRARDPPSNRRVAGVGCLVAGWKRGSTDA